MTEPLGVAITKVGRFRYEVRSFNTLHKDVQWCWSLDHARRLAHRRLKAAYPRSLIERWGPYGRYPNNVLPEDIPESARDQPPVAMIADSLAYPDVGTDCLCRGRRDEQGRCKHEQVWAAAKAARTDPGC